MRHRPLLAYFAALSEQAMTDAQETIVVLEDLRRQVLVASCPVLLDGRSDWWGLDHSND